MIDAHVHFWDPERLHYERLRDLPTLRRRYAPTSVFGGKPDVAGGRLDPWRDDLTRAVRTDGLAA
jgi:predicted TIM-barrel fold metal-dependent hydrolase